MTALEEQRHVAALLLQAIGPAGFALAGASAIREHGLTDRPTHDVDLFATPALDADQFRNAVEHCESVLRQHGYEVTRVRSYPLFARLDLHHAAGDDLEVDLAVNWRANPPVTLSVGPVLAEPDAIADKLSAVYSRGEVRDYLDLDAIRASGRYSDSQLLALGHQHDAGFDVTMFAQQLSRIADIPASYATQYGIDSHTYTIIQQRLYAWAQQLLARTAADADEVSPEAPGRGRDPKPMLQHDRRHPDNDVHCPRPDPDPPQYPSL